MAIEIIKMPSIFQEGPSSNSPTVQKDPIREADSQAWLAGALVLRTGTGSSARLTRVATSASTAELVYGMSPDAAKGSATAAALLTPPFALFGLNHYCFDLRDRILEVNIGTATDANLGTAVGVTYNGGGTGGVALAAGQQYGLRVVAAGTYTGYQILNVADTTNVVFEIVGIAPDKLADNNSSRVMVKIIPSKLQG